VRKTGTSRVLPWLGQVALVVVVSAAFHACGGSGDEDATPGPPSVRTSADSSSTTAVAPLRIRADDFVALADMTPVRGFFVGNLRGDLDGTLEVARSSDGGTYPVGTVIQLVPQEAMVKREPGFSPETNDWEFFSLDVTEEGTSILERGGDDVVNRFGGSCARCHALAEPKWDFVCEQDHGCDPLPIGRDVIELVQEADPRPRIAQPAS
jgi:hypothetical protein